jgi:hypothetical protein
MKLMVQRELSLIHQIRKMDSKLMYKRLVMLVTVMVEVVSLRLQFIT